MMSLLEMETTDMATNELQNIKLEYDADFCQIVASFTIPQHVAKKIADTLTGMRWQDRPAALGRPRLWDADADWVSFECDGNVCSLSINGSFVTLGLYPEATDFDYTATPDVEANWLPFVLPIRSLLSLAH